MMAAVRAVGALTVGLIALGCALARLVPFEPKSAVRPRGIRGNVIALELARTVDEWRGVVPCAPDRASARRNTRGDFGFIVGYWLVFVALSALLMRRTIPFAPWLGGAAALCATVAALADVAENVAIFRCLDAPGNRPSQRLVARKYAVSLVKWGCVFALAALLAPLFWRRGAIDGIAISCLLLVGATIGVIGLHRQALIPSAAGVLALSLLATVPLFLGWPGHFLHGF